MRKHFLTLLLLFVFATNANAQWVQAYFNSTSGWNIQCFAGSGLDLFAGSLGAVLHSSDNGKTWNVPDSGSEPSNVTALAVTGSTVIAATMNGIFRSSDKGESWNQVDKKYPFNSMAVSGQNILAGSDFIYLSTDHGITWQSSSDGMPKTMIHALVSNSTKIFAGTDSGIFISSDNGKSWLSIATDLITKPVVDLVLSGSNIFASVSDTLFYSENNGISWNVIQHPSFTVDCLAIKDSILFATQRDGSSAQAEYSTNNGRNWATFAGGHRLNALIVSGDNLVYGSNNVGINYRQIADILGSSGVKTMSTISNTLNLFPNPTSNIISIRKTPEICASISIVNVLGEKVLEMSPSHSQNVTIDLSNLPSGMYYAILLLPNETIVQKVMKE